MYCYARVNETGLHDQLVCMSKSRLSYCVMCAVVAVVVAMVAVAGTITEMVVGMGPIETRVVVHAHDLTENNQCYYYDCLL